MCGGMVGFAKNLINGLAFGITQIVPGISGSTIAIMLGFYENLLESLNHFNKDRRRHLMFLCPFLIGIAAGIISFSSLVRYLLDAHPVPTMLFFIGQIVGVSLLIQLKLQRPRRFDVLFIFIPIAVMVAISFLDITDNVNPSVFLLFISGVIAAAALITPGISGSFILLVMGVYYAVLDSVSSITSLFRDITNRELWVDILWVILPFALGVIIGGLSMARLIEKLLKKYTRTMYTIVLGLLSGSVYMLLSNNSLIGQIGNEKSIPANIISFTALLSGGLIAFFIGRKRV
jgi:putative membrane protein